MKTLLVLAFAAFPFSAARAASVPVLAAGQSVILCEAADLAADAAKTLNSDLVAGRQQLKVATADGNVIVNAPYDVSALAIASADKEADTACVTLTKR